MVWRGQPCVEGCFVDDDNTISPGAYDTATFESSALPNVVLLARPGLVPMGSGVKTWASESGNREESA